MSKDDVVILMTVVENRDEKGFVNGEDIARTEVFADVKSAARSDYYEALRSGHKVKVAFVVDLDDFKTACITNDGKKKRVSIVEHEGITYRIIREYKLPDNNLELTCEEVE